MRLRPILASLLSAGLMLACGGGGGGSNRTSPTGNLTLRFGADSFPGYNQAFVSLEKVEGSADGANWIALGNVKATFDLMLLQNGHSTVILPATQVSAGNYAQFRITWATVNYLSVAHLPAYLVTNGGVEQILSVPVTTVVNGPVTVAANGNTTAQIMLSGQQAVQVRAGGTPAYTFQATGRAYDLTASARITGHLGDGTTSLSGVEVFAETVDGLGVATIQRRAFTDASGNYTLEGLATGSLYFVAAQPVVASTSYTAMATGQMNATTASTYTADLAFSMPQTPGSLTLTITPASTSTQGTWGELRQPLSTGSVGYQTLIVRSQTVATGSTQDQVGFLGVAPGTYGVTAQRSTSGAVPILNTGSLVPVNAGATTNTFLTFP